MYTSYYHAIHHYRIHQFVIYNKYIQYRLSFLCRFHILFSLVMLIFNFQCIHTVVCPYFPSCANRTTLPFDMCAQLWDISAHCAQMYLKCANDFLHRLQQLGSSKTKMVRLQRNIDNCVVFKTSQHTNVAFGGGKRWSFSAFQQKKKQEKKKKNLNRTQ